MATPEMLGIEATRSGNITSNGETLYVFTDSLRSFGNRLNGMYFQTITGAMGSVGTVVNGLDEVWPDSAGVDATTTISSIGDAFAPVAANISALGTFASTMADKYDEALQTAFDSIEE